MPLSELYRMAKGKLDSTQDKNTSCSNDLSSGPENDFVELVYENGQIMMQGQSSRTRKAPTHSPKPRDTIGNGSNTKYEKFEMMGCELNDFQIPGPSGEMGLNQDEDLVPWLNFPIDKSLQHGYGSDFMTGLSEVTVNEVSTQNQLSSVRSNTVSVQNGVYSSSSSQQCQTSLPSNRSKASVVTNFSHFSRPVAHVKANLQNNGVRPGLGLGSERMGIKDKVSTSCSNVAEPKLLTPSEDVPVEEPITVKDSEFINQENELKGDKSSNQIAASSIKGVLDVEKAVEPVVACSSVCSGNSIERPSDDAAHNSKRKSRDTEDSEWPSEDVEEESVDVKRSAHARAGTSSKRSRAAEVHNLSERRRRDRINEKMRALQELIPNCNKVDKASMLDEAIEYLKTLQLQVQIMSMGAGLYMPPMMMPQHMHAAHMGHFSPMVGMGMGMHYGMGMPDMNYGSSGFPRIQVPPMQGAQFPGPPIVPPMSAPPVIHGIGGSNPQFLDPLSQGHPMPMPRAPSTVGQDPSASPMPNLHSSLVSGSKDLMQKPNSETMQNSCTNSAMNQTSTQCQATSKDLDQSALVQNNGQVADANVGEAVTDADEVDP